MHVVFYFEFACSQMRNRANMAASSVRIRSMGVFDCSLFGQAMLFFQGFFQARPGKNGKKEAPFGTPPFSYPVRWTTIELIDLSLIFVPFLASFLFLRPDALIFGAWFSTEQLRYFLPSSSN